MFTVARNEWRQRNRNKVTHVEIEDKHIGNYEDECFELTEISKPSQSTTEIIEELLTSLGENCKEILSAVIFLKTPMKVIADKMGYASSAIVKTRHYKCKQRLIKTIEKNLNI